jgi:deoxyribose-phosphate aldolase
MDLAPFIDHTILRPDCTPADIERVCAEAKKYNFAAVCVPPYFVGEARQFFSEEEAVKVATVIGFPMGYSTTAAKVEEIKRAIDDGADELDAVINICAARSGHWNFVQNELDRVITAAHLKNKTIKIILETGILNEQEMLRAADICRDLMADFVKTSTGYNGEGATVKVVQLLNKHLEGSGIKIKASGGIRTREDALRLLGAGANRLGCSSSVTIIKG